MNVWAKYKVYLGEWMICSGSEIGLMNTDCSLCISEHWAFKWVKVCRQGRSWTETESALPHICQSYCGDYYNFSKAATFLMFSARYNLLLWSCFLSVLFYNPSIVCFFHRSTTIILLFSYQEYFFLARVKSIKLIQRVFVIINSNQLHT